ncbi:MAG: multiheme c-type cytochrome [Deltaproteobacteria bacterium]|jgi:hypothetical protein
MSKLDSVLACSLMLCGVLAFAPPARSASEQTAKNSCVQCHSSLPASSFVGVKSHSWKGSIHQRHGVTCDKCHGGNPKAAGEKEAHIGVLGSSNPRSTVYYKNIPATCGKCHGAEFYKFTQSLHYKMLESTGKGPDCVTCHGSMVTKVLAPDTLVAVCERCHNERMGIFPYVPQKAKAVLLLLRESKVLLAADQQLYRSPKCTEAPPILRDAGTSLHTAKLDWHQFDLNSITDHLQQFYDELAKLPRLPCVDNKCQK